jgi:KRAB domain-containing zinc finger protein
MSELRYHLQSHNEEKPTCQLCGKAFFNNNKLKRHITEVHEGRKNHMCNHCGKCFARPDKLRDHERVHYGHDRYMLLLNQREVYRMGA